MLILLTLFACNDDYDIHKGIPELTITTMSGSYLVDFDEIAVGARADIGIEVSNVGKGTLNIESFEIDPGGSPDLTIKDPGSTELSPGSSMGVVFRYVPSEIGEDFATATLVTNDPENTETTITLTGFGTEPKLQVSPELLWFGQVDPTNSKELTVTASANGTGTTKITDLIIEDDYNSVFTFDMPNGVVLPYSLQAGISFDVDVTFTPLTAEEYDTWLVFTSNDPAEPTIGVRLLGNSESNPNENEPPSVEITTPVWGTYLIEGENTILSGFAIDVEDGPQNLVCSWYAAGNLLGTSTPNSSGEISLTTSNLPQGDITITLMATDSKGESSSDSVDVTVWSAEEPATYILSGGTSVYHYWTVDDDVRIEVDGVTVFSDTNHTQDNHPPLEIEATKGSEIKIIASDVNYCDLFLDSLYLHFGTGLYQQLNEEFCESACADSPCYDGTYSGPWPNTFLNKTYEIYIP